MRASKHSENSEAKKKWNWALFSLPNVICRILLLSTRLKYRIMQTDKKCPVYFTIIHGLFFLTTTSTATARADAAAMSATLTKFSDSTHELIGYCAPYHGKVCKSFITSSQVWYSNVSVRFPVDDFNFLLRFSLNISLL